MIFIYAYIHLAFPSHSSIQKCPNNNTSGPRRSTVTQVPPTIPAAPADSEWPWTRQPEQLGDAAGGPRPGVGLNLNC